MTRDERFVLTRDYEPRDLGPPNDQLIEGRRRPDPYYHPSPLARPLSYSGYGPEIQDGRPRNLKSAADSDEGIHSLGEEQTGYGDTFKSMGSRTMSPIGTDNMITNGTPKKSKSFKGGNDGKLGSGPSPQRTFYTFEKVREGIMNYVQHLKTRIAELTDKFERGFFGQYGTVSGRFWSESPERFRNLDGFKPVPSPVPNTNPVSLEKRIKNAERLLKHLEYHCTKVDRLHDDYLQNHKLREGAKTMSFAYCDPNNLVSSSTKSMKESLQGLDVERKTCELAMCKIETKLQELMGSYHFCIKEIAGFARIGSGDQFEIVVRYGSLKKFKAHCRVNRKLEQHWDRRGAAFPCLIHDVLELKAKELKTFGKNAQLIRTILDPVEMLSIVPILKFVKLNQNGSLKLNMLFFWNPLGNEPAEELEYLYGQQFIDAFLTTPTPSEFQLPFLPVLDHVTASQTMPARIRAPVNAIGSSPDQWNRERSRDKPISSSIDQWDRERARVKPISSSIDQWDRERTRDKVVDPSLDQWLQERARDKPIGSPKDQWDRELPRNKRNVRKSLDPYLYTTEGKELFGGQQQPLESTPQNEDSGRRGPGLQRSFMVEEQVAGYDFGENRHFGGVGTQPIRYRNDAEGSGQFAQKRGVPAEKGRPRPVTVYENYGREAQPYAVGESYGAGAVSRVKPDPPSTPSPQDFSLGRDFGHALDDVIDAIQARDAGPGGELMELEEIQTMLQQFRMHLRDSSRDKKRYGRRNKGTCVGSSGDYGNGGDEIYLGSLFRKNVGSGSNGNDDPYGTGRFGYRDDVEKQNGRHTLEDKRRTYNFETTPTSYYAYEEENEKRVTRRPDSRNVDMILKSFDFLGPPSTTSRNTPLNQSHDTLQNQPDAQLYYYGQGSAFKPDPARPGRVIPGRKTPIDSGVDSGSCEGETGDGLLQQQYQPLLLTTGDPNVDRVIHVHLVLLSQGLQKLSQSQDKPLTRGRLVKLVNIHALCLEILYEIVVHGVPHDQNVIVAIVNKYSNLNGWGNVNQIVDFWKRMNGSTSFLSGHVYRIQTNLERHYLPFLLEKHSQQVISLVFPKEINQIQQIVPAGLDQIEDVRHCVTLLQFVLYLKMQGIQDFKIHLEEIARELEFRDLFATGNQNGIIKFLLSLRNELPPGDSFDVICRLLCNNEEINRFTVAYLTRVQSNFRLRRTAVAQALTCLESNESIIRCGACRALQHLKATESIPQLARTFQHDPNFRVKEFARISLLNMGSAGIRAYDEILSSGPTRPVSADYRTGNSTARQFGTRSALYDVDSKL